MPGNSVDRYKRVTDTVLAVATSVLALSLMVMVLQYIEDKRTASLNRTLSLVSTANTHFYSGVDHDAMLDLFPDRWPRTIVTPLPRARALTYFEVSGHPQKDPDLYKQWDVVRRHLNQLEVIAYEYVRDLVDKKIIVEQYCVFMMKSAEYFKEVIDVFSKEVGSGQSWAVIPRAVADMRSDYPGKCQN